MSLPLDFDLPLDLYYWLLHHLFLFLPMFSMTRDAKNLKIICKSNSMGNGVPRLMPRLKAIQVSKISIQECYDAVHISLLYGMLCFSKISSEPERNMLQQHTIYVPLCAFNSSIFHFNPLLMYFVNILQSSLLIYHLYLLTTKIFEIHQNIHRNSENLFCNTIK